MWNARKIVQISVQKFKFRFKKCEGENKGYKWGVS